MPPSRGLLALTMCLLLTSVVRICTAATFTCPAGDSACLIAAIHTANSTHEPDTIQLAAGTYTLTTVDNITDTSNGLPSITSTVTIQGVGAEQTIIERRMDAPYFRLMHVEASGTLTIDGLTLAGGWVDGAGGILNDGGSLTIVDSMVRNNESSLGGGGGLLNRGTARILRSTLRGNIARLSGSGAGIFNNGTLHLIDSALTENVSDLDGGLSNHGGASLIINSTVARNSGGQPGGGVGGLLNGWGGTLTLINSTVVDNEGKEDAESGGVGNYGGTVVLQNTIVARNVYRDQWHRTEAPDCFGTISSQGHNLIGDPTGCTVSLQPTDLTGDPGLGEFTDDGTPGNGHFPLRADSPLIGAGDDNACPETDQLGNPRFSPCDIGAVEFQPGGPPTLAMRLNQTTFTPGQTLRVTLDVENPGLARSADFYLAVLLPDGVTTLLITQLSPLQGFVTTLSQPSAFRPLFAHVPLAQGLDITLNNLLTYRWTGLETSGTYHLIAALTPVGAFADGSIDEGDILALDWDAFTFSAGASGLYAKMRAIQARHLAQASPSWGDVENLDSSDIAVQRTVD